VKLFQERNADIPWQRQEPVPGDQGGYPFVDVTRNDIPLMPGMKGC